jgi:hypothetical protein
MSNAMGNMFTHSFTKSITHHNGHYPLCGPDKSKYIVFCLRISDIFTGRFAWQAFRMSNAMGNLSVHSFTELTTHHNGHYPLCGPDKSKYIDFHLRISDILTGRFA